MTTNAENFIWHQTLPNKEDARPGSDAVPDDRALVIAVPGVEQDATAELLSDGKTVVISQGGKEAHKFKLYEKVLPVGQIESQVQDNGTIVMMLVKADREVWTQLIEEPIPSNDPGFVDESVINQLLQDQVPSLPNEEQEKLQKPEDMHKITQMQLANLKDEKEQITGKIAQYNKELEGSSDPESGKVLLGSEKEEIRRRLNVLEALTEINTRLRNTMEKPVSVKNMLEIQQIEIEKSRKNAGADSAEEKEDFKDEEEAKLDAKQLTELAMTSIQNKTKEGFMEGMRLLRVAAIHKNDPSAAIILFRLYSEMEEVGKAAYFVVRRARMDDCEPLTNSMCGAFHDDGMQLFPPWTGLAVYYYQRAAKSGRQCMLDLSNIWRKGYTKGTEQIVTALKQRVQPDPERQFIWLRHSLARGSGQAQFLKCQLHMQGDGGFELSKKKAVESWSRALASAPQLQQHQKQIEGYLAQMPDTGADGGAGPSSAGAAPSAAPVGAAPGAGAYGKPDTSEFGAVHQDTESEGGFLSSTLGQGLIVGVLTIGVVVAVPPIRRAVLGIFGK